MYRPKDRGITEEIDGRKYAQIGPFSFLFLRLFPYTRGYVDDCEEGTRQISKMTDKRTTKNRKGMNWRRQESIVM